jgi:serine protease
MVRSSRPVELLGLISMSKICKPLILLAVAALSVTALGSAPAGAAAAAPAEWNPLRVRDVQIGPQANRLIVGFKATSDNSRVMTINLRNHTGAARVVEAQTNATEIRSLSQRTGVAVASSRQLTPSMHVLFLPSTLYGVEIGATLQQLRADPNVEFAEVDQRRYPHALPDDPLFMASPGATGQWYMQTPSALTATSDAAATDAISAWDITTGSSGTVIADVDTGVRFDHPDLGRAGFGGRLLPGYDFVGEDLNRTNSAPLGSFLIANDGDGWDPDPSDPGDWISATDLKNALFPPASCGDPNSNPVDGPVNSSWHGTRVVGVLGAVTNNAAGIAGMTWNPYVLPVRALGKCGGYDSDIMAGMRWAAGLTVTNSDGTDVIDNPFPADIINLSLGGSGTCPSSYQSVINTLTGIGVLMVVSAGNQSGPVDAPANCAGVLAVAGLRNVGTKVGYSSLGPEVGISAPAGNCVDTSGATCLRSIDTTTNSGSTTPLVNTYTNQSNANLGTSFSAPIVAGVAALMRAVNANLTPPQLIARIKASAVAFPQPAGTPVCSSTTSSSVECTCTTAVCGAGMLNAFNAVKAALNPIAAIKIPNGLSLNVAATFDATGSAAACNVAGALSYAWSSTGTVSIMSGGSTAQPVIRWHGAGSLSVRVTDAAGNFDTATVSFTASSHSSGAPASAGSADTACPVPLSVTPAAPTATQVFAPTSVAVNVPATLTMTLSNSNEFALTQTALTQTLPGNLIVVSTPAASSTCGGALRSLSSTSGAVSLSNAVIPAQGSCTVTFGVQSAAAGAYSSDIAVGALSTGPAGSNVETMTASLTVTSAVAATSGGGGGGGGEIDWLDIMFVTGLLLACRRHVGRPRTRD